MKEPQPSSSYISRTKACRGCRSPRLKEVYDLGEQELINLGDKEPLTAPLVLMRCEDCNLIQLRDTVSRDYCFRKYYFKSAANKTLIANLKEVVEEVQKRVELKAGDLVVDIGSNDGTLFGFYPTETLKLGFEPSQIGRKRWVENRTWVEPSFFSLANWPVGWRGGQAKAITALYMFYDLEDPNAFLQDVKRVLAPDGLFVIEMNDLRQMLENVAYDNISHEHLIYYSITTLNNLLEKNGFRITNVSHNNINGGAFRVYVKHDDGKHAPLSAFLDESDFDTRLDEDKPYARFASRIKDATYALRKFVEDETASGKVIDLIAASTRGAVIVQNARIAPFIRFAVERNPEKVAKSYLNVPIVSEETFKLFPPDYAIILPYSFEKEVRERYEWFLEGGGGLIVPLPSPKLITKEEEKPL